MIKYSLLVSGALTLAACLGVWPALKKSKKFIFGTGEASLAA